MTKTQRRQAAKGKAFNSILKIFHPKSDWRPSEFPRDESYSDKRDYEVQRIMELYFKELHEINNSQDKKMPV